MTYPLNLMGSLVVGVRERGTQSSPARGKAFFLLIILKLMVRLRAFKKRTPSFETRSSDFETRTSNPETRTSNLHRGMLSLRKRKRFRFELYKCPPDTHVFKQGLYHDTIVRACLYLRAEITSKRVIELETVATLLEAENSKLEAEYGPISGNSAT